MITQRIANPYHAGLSPVLCSNQQEAWSSLVYGNSLENCRVERHREFESHRFHQMIVVGKYNNE